MSNFLVTGGAGFIGSNLAECLLEKGHNVRILDNFSTGKQENLEGFNKFPEILEADIRDFQAAKEAMEGIDCCFHEAALGSVTRSIENPRNSIEVNVKGTLNILLAA
ncbi:MAG: NAD-dependent epimerase/dehydratase family protein, partial [Synergistota bacterium]|nr:NAD-dependent epimerase/dehydratase family protein [Synergistota bacterium]